MPLFPLYVDLKEKNCVFVGGGKVAARKISTLLEFGPNIKVISPKPDMMICELYKNKRLELIEREYEDGDIEGAFIAFAATSDRTVNHKIYMACKEKNILVNVADCKEECTFTFPSIVTRDELVIGISSSGSYPALSKKVGQKIEDILPEELDIDFEFLKEHRKKTLEDIKTPGKKKEILNKALDQLF